MRKALLIVFAAILVGWPGTAAAAEDEVRAPEIRFGQLMKEEARRLAAESADRFSQSPLSSLRRVRCDSKQHGLLYGALIGAAAGVVFAIVVARGISYGSHQASVQKKHVIGFGAIGAGVGAVVGLGICSK